MSAVRNPNLSAARVRELLHYDPATGAFKWRHKGRRRSKVGGPDSLGYIKIKVDGAQCAAHRLAWVWMTGSWPTGHMDHRNGIRSDNRWCNLREATIAENAQNRVSRNKTGFTGVYAMPGRNKWQATIETSGRKRCLGYFSTPEEASAAYLAAKRELHTFQPVPRSA